jgi:hypothetical protein
MAHTNAKSQSLLAGIIAAAALSWSGGQRGGPELHAARHDLMDRRRTRQRNADRRRRSAAVWTGAGDVRQGPSLY